MKSSSLLAIAGLALGAAAPASAWVLEDCPPEKKAALVAYEQHVRQAQPGSPLYVPHPYPDTLPKLLSDLEHSFRETWRTTPEKQVPAEDRRLLEALAGGKVRAVWEPVQDWTFIRCGRPGGLGLGDLVLLRLSDEAGQPLGRFALRESGHWAAAEFPQEGPDAAENRRAEAEFGSAAELASRWRASLAAEPSGAQWVVTHGTMRCPLVAPCLVFRAGGESYIVQRSVLFRLVLGGNLPRASELLSNLPRTAATNAVFAQVEMGKRHLVTVGFDRVVFAERVER